MKKLACIAYVLALFGFTTSAMTHAGDVEKAQVVLKGLDPVSLLKGKEVSGVETLSSTRGRFRYLFVDAEHKAIFDANPERYAVQGEKCTVMPKAPASPDLFLVHDGKIFSSALPAAELASGPTPQHSSS